MTLQEDIRKACRVLVNGGIILYPTDTVWGIGCDATNPEAVKRIYALKRRSDSKAMISLVSDTDMLRRYAGNTAIEILDSVRGLFSKPVTVIYPNVSGICSEMLAEDGSCGIRITGEAYSCGICAELGRPVVSTSANISGYPPPSFFKEISEEITGGVDYVASYRRDDFTPHQPSAVVLAYGSTSAPAIKIIRS